MKNGILIIGSGHQGGCTHLMADAFQKGAESAGKKLTVLDCTKETIHPCLDCRCCLNRQEIRRPYPCIYQDGMEILYQAFDEADTIIFASPVYFDGVSAQLKAVIDRLYAVGAGYDFHYPAKNCALMMTAESKREDCFEGPLEMYRRAFLSYMKWTSCGQLLIRSCDKPEDFNLVLGPEQAFDFGKEL